VTWIGPAARAIGIVKRFGKEGPPALDGVNISVVPGLMTGLVGPDGAGKTTLIRILAGLIVPDEGETTVLGATALTADRSQIGYMPQRFGLYEDLSAIENLKLFADLRGLPSAERASNLSRLLDFTDLKRFQDRLAGKLSGGMKQKLGLACALVRKPKLLLLDEPSVGVDPVSRRELWDMVRTLSGEGVGVLWSTAYLDEAEKCDTVFLLSEGKLLHDGPPGNLIARVTERVVRIAVPPADRRYILGRAIDRDDVIDGTVQGAAVRLLLKDKSVKLTADDLGVTGTFDSQSVDPRFEDAFIDMLGGSSRGTSELARAFREISSDDAPAIEAQNLTKKFGAFTAASNVSFSISRGEIFGLLGPNGAGKSVTFKMLCGLLTPTSGSGSVAGFDLRGAKADARQSLGYMAQKFSLYGDLSVQQNLNFFAGIYGLKGATLRDATKRVTEIFNLGRYLTVNSSTLPLGYKQRLALACAVMHEPPVLFLDEPTSGVDPIVRREFWRHINGLVDKGVTVLVTTHFMDEAEYCDRIALIYRAEQIATGTPDALKRQAGKPDATMEDAFIALIEAADDKRKAA
jgi:ABC-2 type transport system ATP-binding protein